MVSNSFDFKWWIFWSAYSLFWLGYDIARGKWLWATFMGAMLVLYAVLSVRAYRRLMKETRIVIEADKVDFNVTPKRKK